MKPERLSELRKIGEKHNWCSLKDCNHGLACKGLIEALDTIEKARDQLARPNPSVSFLRATLKVKKP